LADKARLEARRAALRTRDGVVALDEWREALKAKQGLEKLLGNPEWLLGIRLAPSPTVGVRLVVTFLWDSAQARMCVPCSVNDVEVVEEVRNAGRRAAPPRTT
jgi:hypothetical protein